MLSSIRFMAAIQNREFKPYIQPLVSTTNGSISGGELLARWHTNGKIIRPEHFIMAVESAGLIPEMTMQMLEQIDKEVHNTEDNKRLNNLILSVNITPELLNNRIFINDCLTLNKRKKFRFVLELTEQKPFVLNSSTVRMMDKLCASGVKFALDDFGTGCSTLSYLKYFPVHYIKIDKSFVRGILVDDICKHIIESIIALADKLNISIIAEGIEEKEQADILYSMGVSYFQGYYFGKPEPLNNFIRHMFSSNRIYN